MTIKTILKTAEKFVVNNSPGILTGLGVAGAVTTAVLAGRAGFRAGMDASTQYHETLNKQEEGEPLPAHLLEPKHLVKTYWKEFIPAGAVGSATVTAIIMANQIGSRRAAAVAAAFKLSEQLTEEYKARVVQTLGLQKEEKMRADLAADRITKNPPPANMVIVTGADVLFLDELSGRYFHSQVETIRKAVNDINHQINNYFHASVTDFYDKIGLDGTKHSDAIGWNTDELLDVQFTATIYDSKPVIVLGYNYGPILGYDRVQ